MTSDVHEKYGLKRVINASGKMTILGVSKVSDDVAALQKLGGQNFFEMEDLVEKTGSYIARMLHAENAVVVSSASAGIAQSVAAFIGRGDKYHVYHPYAPELTRREIVLPKGHNVDYGTAVDVMIELGGGKVREAGYANMCSQEHVEMMITENTAALLYVKSHHTVQKSMLTVTQMVEVARKHDVPLIVDAAAEEDLFGYTRQGADLVIYSGAKAIGGPTSGLVVGKDVPVRWVKLQAKGIGRAMKIGKENIVAFAGALEEYLKNPGETGAKMQERLRPFVAALNNIEGIEAQQVQDPAGRDIYRACVKAADAQEAARIISALKYYDPAVYTREYQANKGIIEFDVRAVDTAELTHIAERIQQIMEQGKRNE